MKNFSEFVLEVTKAQGIGQISEIQSLWSGYGSIKRLQVKGAGAPSVIVKLVRPPSSADHPGGGIPDFPTSGSLSPIRWNRTGTVTERWMVPGEMHEFPNAMGFIRMVIRFCWY